MGSGNWFKVMICSGKTKGSSKNAKVEWCGGPETMEEILARIHYREEAAVKRERDLAYFLINGDPILVRTKGWEIINLTKVTGVGAGRTGALLLAQGKSASPPIRHLLERLKLSKLARFKRISVKSTMVNAKDRRLSFSDIEKTVTQ